MGYWPLVLGGPDEIPPLRPPKPEMPPGFWEQHGLLVSVTGLVILVLLILLWRMVSRPRPPVIPAPATVARQSLEPLRHQAGDAVLSTHVSGILRTYLIRALGLPDEQLTSIELSARLGSHPGVTPHVATAAAELLRGMEHQRFNADSINADATVVQRALALIDQVETMLDPQPGSATAGGAGA